MKLWGGRFTSDIDELVLKYTASISFDKRLAPYDIKGSIAHARMLAECGIITAAEGRDIISGLESLAEDISAGEVQFRLDDEDIHMNVERLLTDRIGPVAGKLHTGRSRNDQVALDMHLFTRDVTEEVLAAIAELQNALIEQADLHMDVIVPGFTHLQRAQPILFSHHLLAYFWMLERDKVRLQNLLTEVDMMPLGAGALAGTTFPIDRQMVASELGFSKLYENSLDAVSDRDYILTFLFATATIMTHLSRLSEELVLWSSEEFGWIELADGYATGSSMMPQKKNPDVPELIRGKTGRMVGNLVGLFTVMKGLPLAYNKDLQEDKEGIFDAVDTIIPALILMTGTISTMKLRLDRLKGVFDRDFSNATDLADYLVRQGLPFRDAHRVVGELVQLAISRGTNLLDLPLDVMREKSNLISDDVFAALTPQSVVGARQSRGGTGPSAVKLQLALAKERCKSDNV